MIFSLFTAVISDKRHVISANAGDLDRKHPVRVRPVTSDEHQSDVMT